MDNFTALVYQLDQDQPDWWIEWANEAERIDYMRDMTRAPENAVGRVKRRIFLRIFHRVLNASITAGLVTEVTKP